MPTERDPASDLIAVFLNLAVLDVDFFDAVSAVTIIDRQVHRLSHKNVWPAVGAAVVGEYAPIREYGVSLTTADDDPFSSPTMKALARLRRIADQLEAQ